MILAIYSLALLLINLPVVTALVNHAMQDVTASHLLLVPVVTATLMYQSRERIFAIRRPAWLGGSLVIAAGIGLMFAGRMAWRPADPVDALSVMVAALVVAWLGGFLLIYGAAAARAAMFPLAFLCFTIPLPTALLQMATHFLKSGSSAMVATLFTLTDTPFHRQAYTFTLPDLVIEVADECSGIRSSIALFLTGLLAGQTFLTSSWARVLALMAILPIAILKNGIRIASLCLLAMHVDPSFLTGQLHHDGGIAFFAMALGMLAPIFYGLRRLELTHASHPARYPPQ